MRFALALGVAGVFVSIAALAQDVPDAGCMTVAGQTVTCTGTGRVLDVPSMRCDEVGAWAAQACAAGDTGGATAPAAGGAGDAAGVAPRTTVQQMQLDAAKQLGNAVGQRFVQWLLKKRDDDVDQQQKILAEQQRQQDVLRQQAQQELQRKAAEQAKFEAGKKELNDQLKGGSFTDFDLTFKDDDLHRTFARNEELFHDRTHWDDYLRTGMDHQKALTKADATNKPNEDWCHLHLPLWGAPETEKRTWACLCASDCAPAPPPDDPDKIPLP